MSKRKKRNKALPDQQISQQVAEIRQNVHGESYSGLDPMYTVKSASALEGAFLQKAFTGRLRTKNPFLLTLMGVTGILIILPAFCALLEKMSSVENQAEVIKTVDENGAIFLQIKNPPGPDIPTEILIIFGLMALFGLILLINLVINLWKNQAK